MSLRNIVQVVILISVLLAGCARKIPDVGISSQYLNSHLEIQPTPNINKFGFNETIALNIKARTSIEVKVTFSSIRIFMFDEKISDWQEIGEINDNNPFLALGIVGNLDLPNEISSDLPDVILSKGCVDNHCKKVETFGVKPNVKNNGKSVDVLVVVSGNIYKNGIMTDQKTGAYIIFTLRP